jgi:uncharacterized protein
MPKVSAVSQGVRGIMMILSPAKTLDFKPIDPSRSSSLPPSTWPTCNPHRTAEIASAMKQKSQSELAKLLLISPALASSTKRFWDEFVVTVDPHSAEEESAKEDGAPPQTKPCIFAYAGPAFLGLEASSCSDTGLRYLQSNLRIVDAVYGLLRPMDRIQPYRLEMATKKVLENEARLSAYWSESVTDALKTDLEERQDAVLLNLASEEYSSTVDMSELLRCGAHCLKAVFQEEGRVISVHAKRARGLMARYVAENDVSSIDGIKMFAEEGYAFVESRSDDTTLVFDRKKQAAAKRRATAPSKATTEKSTTTIKKRQRK